jgi:hypothetical protein
MAWMQGIELAARLLEQWQGRVLRVLSSDAALMSMSSTINPSPRHDLPPCAILAGTTQSCPPSLHDGCPHSASTSSTSCSAVLNREILNQSDAVSDINEITVHLPHQIFAKKPQTH